jgi:hypothetical protein
MMNGWGVSLIRWAMIRAKPPEPAIAIRIMLSSELCVIFLSPTLSLYSDDGFNFWCPSSLTARQKMSL